MKKFMHFFLWTILGIACFCALFSIGYFSYLFMFNQHTQEKNNPITFPADDAEAMAQIDTIGDKCRITFRHFYTDCSHVVDEVLPPPNKYNGKTMNEILSVYQDSGIESKNDNEIIIKVYEHKKCDKHYLAKLEDNKIVIHLQNDPTKIKETINISSSGLSYEDTILLTQGVYLESDEELTGFMEDYAS